MNNSINGQAPRIPHILTLAAPQRGQAAQQAPVTGPIQQAALHIAVHVPPQAMQFGNSQPSTPTNQPITGNPVATHVLPQARRAAQQVNNPFDQLAQQAQAAGVHRHIPFN